MPASVTSATTAELDSTARRDRTEMVIGPPSWSPGLPLLGIRAVWEHRDLLYTLTLHRFRVRYKQSVLGLLWAVLQPLATMAVLTVVFSFIARVPTGGVPYAVFALAGLVPWTCFSNALTSGTQSLVSHAALVTRVRFPREILPLTYVLAAVADGVIAGGLLVAVMAAYGLPPGPSAWAALPIFATLVALVTGLALAAAAVNVRFRDVGVAMPIVLQLLLFASPIAYALSSVPHRGATLYTLNPLAGLIENFRRAVLGTEPLHVESLLVSVAWAALVLPLGYVWFKHVDATAADVI
jgi:lipopolysaccharide transport system permease protein